MQPWLLVLASLARLGHHCHLLNNWKPSAVQVGVSFGGVGGSLQLPLPKIFVQCCWHMATVGCQGIEVWGSLCSVALQWHRQAWQSHRAGVAGGLRFSGSASTGLGGGGDGYGNRLSHGIKILSGLCFCLAEFPHSSAVLECLQNVHCSLGCICIS